jgi:hypothetical protein
MLIEMPNTFGGDVLVDLQVLSLARMHIDPAGDGLPAFCAGIAVRVRIIAVRSRLFVCRDMHLGSTFPRHGYRIRGRAG